MPIAMASCVFYIYMFVKYFLKLLQTPKISDDGNQDPPYTTAHDSQTSPPSNFSVVPSKDLFDPDAMAKISDKFPGVDDIDDLTSPKHLTPPPLPHIKETPTVKQLMNNASEDMELSQLRRILRESPVFISEDIIKAFENLGLLCGDPSLKLARSYERLVDLAGPNMSSFKEDIIRSSKDGYKALSWAIKMCHEGYKTAPSLKTKDMITHLSVITDDFKDLHKTLMARAESYRTTIQHCAVSWNHTLTSMTKYASALEILTDSAPTSRTHLKGISTVSTSSKAKEERYEDLILRFEVGKQYKSIAGILEVKGDNLSLAASGGLGSLLSLPIKYGVRKGAIELLFSKDLTALSHHIQDHKFQFEQYKCMSLEQKKEFIYKVAGALPTGNKQWTVID